MKQFNIKQYFKIFFPLIVVGISVLFISCGGDNFRQTGKKVIILGIDGMDPGFLQEFMERGQLPNLTRLAAEGSFKPLTTSQPPQSPVAWSNFITGMDPGGHGIFDFIHREPQSKMPYLSTSRMTESEKVLKLGKYRIPLKSGKAELLRKGDAFWQILERQGIESIIYRVPSNFPPAETQARTFAGMGTPDILGSYGIFTFLTDDSSLYKEDIAGGKMILVDASHGEIHAEIEGPHNSLVKDNPPTSAEFTAYIDPIDDNLRIEIGDEDFFLRPGEWSDWAEIEFPLMAFAKASGIVRFYLKEIRPNFKLYISPVNIAPNNPALPLSTPADWSKEIYRNIGNFYTLGMPEDTKALSAGVLDFEDYLSQARKVLEERIREFDYVWNEFDDGVFFFYFGTLDQSSHALYSTFDEKSPIYDTENEHLYGRELMNLYAEMDKVIGRVMDEIGSDDLLLVMSDHGFAPFRYCFDLNTWLLNNGYITLKDESKRDQEFFPGVNWRKSKAYGLGINGLYLNQRGRERNGVVSPGAEAEALKDELIQKLTGIIDPNSGEKVINVVQRREDIYHGPEMENAPDLLVGYGWGYRASWETILGKFPENVISDNPDKWAGDHCVDNKLVPGVILSNRQILHPSPALYDLTPTILHEFGIAVPDNMIGRSIFDDSKQMESAYGNNN